MCPFSIFEGVATLSNNGSSLTSRHRRLAGCSVCHERQNQEKYLSKIAVKLRIMMETYFFLSFCVSRVRIHTTLSTLCDIVEWAFGWRRRMEMSTEGENVEILTACRDGSLGVVGRWSITRCGLWTVKIMCLPSVFPQRIFSMLIIVTVSTAKLFQVGGTTESETIHSLQNQILFRLFSNDDAIWEISSKNFSLSYFFLLRLLIDFLFHCLLSSLRFSTAILRKALNSAEVTRWYRWRMYSSGWSFLFLDAIESNLHFPDNIGDCVFSQLFYSLHGRRSLGKY